MNNGEYLYDVLVFLIAAVIIVPVFQRLRTSPILGYLAAGILIGPYGFAFIKDSHSAHSLAEFGVVFLLFMIGLELSLERLRTLRRFVFGLGAIQVGVTWVLIAGVASAMGIGTEGAIIIGGGLALSSTAFVLQLLIERGERTTPFGMAAFSILLFQDLAVVPLLLMVDLMASGEGSFLSTTGLALVEAAIAIAAVVILGRWVLRPVYKVIAGTGSSELFVATTLLVVLGAGWLMAQAGMSMILGAFLAGLLLSESEYKHQIDADIRPFRGILLGLFFITVGMSINIAFVVDHFAVIGLIVIAILLGKSLVISFLCRIFGLSSDVSLRTGLLLSQGGEFGFVLFISASALGLLSAEVVQYLLAVIALTMAVTPLIALLGEKLTALLRPKESLPGLESSPEPAVNHVLIAGFGRVGQTVSRVVAAAGLPYVALDLDQNRISACRGKSMSVYYGDATRIDVLRSVGAEHARIAVITIDQAAQSAQILSALRELSPDLPVTVRARDIEHGRKLEIDGAIRAIPEALEASLQLGAITISSIGVNAEEVSGILGDLREDDYADMAEVVK